MNRSGFYKPHFAATAQVSPLGSPSVMNMLALLVQHMFAIAYGENKFMLLQMKGFDLGGGTGSAEQTKRMNCIWGWPHQIGLGALFVTHC